MPNNEPIIAPDLPSLMSEQKEQAIGIYRSAGYSEEQIAKAFGTPPPQEPAIGDALGVGNGQTPPDNPQQRSIYSSGSSLQYDQKVAGLKAALKYGANVAEVLDAAKAEGVDINDLALKDDAEPSQEAMTLYDANQHLRTNDPAPFMAGQQSDYTFQFDRDVAADLTVDELRQVNDQFASAFATAAIPLSVSRSVFRTMQEAQKAYQNATDPNALRLRFATEGSKVNRLSQNAAQMRADHEYAFSKFPDDFRKWANANFVFHTADSFIALANAGRLMKEREAIRAKRK
jgi:hypothetical protein